MKRKGIKIIIALILFLIAIIIKFNGKDEYKVKTYRIKNFDNKNNNCKFDFEE